MSIDVHDAFIVEFKNACPNSLCDEMIDFYENNKQEDQLMTGNRPPVHTKTSTDVPMNASVDKHVKLDRKYQDIIYRKKIEYTKILIKKGLDRRPNNITPYTIESFVEVSGQTGLIVQKSNTGEYYKWHSDWKPKYDRFLTCILYLNTLGDDDGGTTRFTNGRVIKPEKGKLLIFPATMSYVHQGDIVKKGPKYIAVTFCTYVDMNNNHPNTKFNFVYM